MLHKRARLMAKSFDYLVVGGGNAAGYAIRELVGQGVGAGKIGIMSAEPVPPYERPALTKAYLHPPSAKVRARLPGFHTCVGGGGDRQTPEWYVEKGVDIIQDKATGVDFASKTVTGSTGEACTYGKLILATGARPLRASQFGVTGDDLQNVFYIREEHDAAALVKKLETLGGGGKAVVVGGGYIGLECAAALVGWGVDTTMVFPEASCMPRLFNAELGKWLEDQYVARGIKVRKGELATEFTGNGQDVTGVKLKSGEALPCDLAVVGIGAAPNVEFCTGLTMEKGGFAVDSSMATSDPSVFAIGDVCAFPSQYGGLMRCEHVDHARKSAAQAVQAAMGLAPEPYKYLPYFYSRIFEYTDAPIVFNFFGDDSGEIKIVKQGAKSISAVWVKNEKIVGALLMGSPGPSADDMAKLRELASAQPAVSDSTTEFLMQSTL